MAKSIQFKLPSEMSSFFGDLKDVRSKKCEPTTYQSIVIDAIKAYHKSKVKK